MGEYGFEPYYCAIIRAAKILNHSAVDLMRDEERAELMAMAFTFEKGTTQGEWDREFVAEYQRLKKEAEAKIRSARGG